MRQVVHLISGIVLGAWLASFAFGASARTSAQDPVKLSPQYYKVLLDNDDIRVLEYRLKPGQKEPMHSHPRGVVYYFGDARFKITSPNGTSTESAVTPGQTVWREGVTHASENVGDTEAHALGIELKKACAP